MALTNFLFKEKEEKFLKQIEELKTKLEEKEVEILNLKKDLEIITAKKDNNIGEKQLEIFERNLKQNIENSKRYKSILILYKLNPEKIQYKYKVDLKYFYSEKKFEEILNILNEKNILFVNDIKEEDFNDVPEETKNSEEVPEGQ